MAGLDDPNPVDREASGARPRARLGAARLIVLIGWASVPLMVPMAVLSYGAALPLVIAGPVVSSIALVSVRQTDEPDPRRLRTDWLHSLGLLMFGMVVVVGDLIWAWGSAWRCDESCATRGSWEDDGTLSWTHFSDSWQWDLMLVLAILSLLSFAVALVAAVTPRWRRSTPWVLLVTAALTVAPLAIPGRVS